MNKRYFKRNVVNMKNKSRLVVTLIGLEKYDIILKIIIIAFPRSVALTRFNKFETSETYDFTLPI